MSFRTPAGWLGHRFRTRSPKAIRAAGPTTLTFDAKYQSAINQFFTDVAA